MKSFKSFFRTSVGMKDQSEGVEKQASDVPLGMKKAVGGDNAPEAAAEDVSTASLPQQVSGMN